MMATCGDGDERNSSTVIWQIKNFTCYDARIHKHEICSPWITFPILDVKHCCLFLKMNCRHRSLKLYLEETLAFLIDCEFSFLAPDGTILVTRTVRNRQIKGPTHIWMPKCPSYEELFKDKNSCFSSRDTATARCRIWKSSGDIGIAETVSVCSQFKISEDCFLWPIGGLVKLKDLQKKRDLGFCGASQEMEDFKVDCWFSGDFLKNSELGFTVHANYIIETLLMKLKVSMLGNGQKATKLFETEHTFIESNREQSWSLEKCPLKDELRKKMLKFRCDKSLNLLFQFTVVHQRMLESERMCIGTSTLELAKERTLPSPNVSEASCQTSQIMDIVPDNLQRVSNSVDILVGDLKIMHTQQTMSDFELRSGDIVFPVHKNILSARSPVFKSIFTDDIEASCKSMDIPDLDSDTLSQLLSFLYTGSVETDLNVQCAAKLYYASDKYQVDSLKQQCFSVLQSVTSVTNVSEVLVLAHRCQCQELISFVGDFIQRHFNAVVHSEEWGKFLENDPFLAGTTMRKVYTQINPHLK